MHHNLDAVMIFKRKFATTVLFIQLVFIILFGFFVDYGEDSNATHPKNYYLNSSKEPNNAFHSFYPMFQDINALIFVGVGFLYTFLKKYGYSGVGMNLLLAGIAVEWSILTHNWWNLTNGKIQLDIASLISGEFAAASAVIALGGVFGKISPLQMVVFTLTEVFIYTTNEHFCITGFHISDVGGSVSLHMFAGIFGCVAAYVIDRKVDVQNHPNDSSSYESNIFCMLGTSLLWVYWPSFNAALSTGDTQVRCAMNTFLGLLGSCLTAFAISSLTHKENKFTMSHIQNATLAGGVAIGTTSDLMIQPFGALLIGALGGCISVFGFQFLSPFLARMKVYDPCGINSLHGLPGFFAGITGIVAALFASEKTYGHSLYKIYPAMAPVCNTTELMAIQHFSPDVMPGLGRSSTLQACYQFLYIIEVILIAIICGALTGSLLRIPIFDNIEDKQMYTDETFWVIPEKNKKKIMCNVIDSKV